MEAILALIRCIGVVLSSKDVMFCSPSRYASRLSEDAFLELDTDPAGTAGFLWQSLLLVGLPRGPKENRIQIVVRLGGVWMCRYFKLF